MASSREVLGGSRHACSDRIQPIPVRKVLSFEESKPGFFRPEKELFVYNDLSYTILSRRERRRDESQGRNARVLELRRDRQGASLEYRSRRAEPAIRAR